jgi:hypothetical protein
MDEFTVMEDFFALYLEESFHAAPFLTISLIFMCKQTLLDLKSCNFMILPSLNQSSEKECTGNARNGSTKRLLDRLL